MMSAQTADETRARILKEAERLFRHYGYSKTTVADIADACGMSSANVYRFFASKSEIVEAICGLIISDLEGQLRKIAISGAPASERLTQFIELLARYTAETLIHEKKVHDMVVVAMEENWDEIKRHLQAVTSMIAGIIASGIESGEFKRQDPQQAARCVHFALVGLKHPLVAAQCCGDPDNPSPSEMAAFILSALKA
ncbi:MAG: TetR/AcrR family transcriptional regulator [Rhodomicrobium sp.]|nr:TetR/AcrR family transcriptional regulator [Rhodomicrobium sp.]